MSSAAQATEGRALAELGGFPRVPSPLLGRRMREDVLPSRAGRTDGSPGRVGGSSRTRLQECAVPRAAAGAAAPRPGLSASRAPDSQTQAATSGCGNDRACLFVSVPPDHFSLVAGGGEGRRAGQSDRRSLLTPGRTTLGAAHAPAYRCGNQRRLLGRASSRGLGLGSALGTPRHPLQPRGLRRSTGRSQSPGRARAVTECLKL